MLCVQLESYSYQQSDFGLRINYVVSGGSNPPVHLFKSDYRFRSLPCVQVGNLANKLVGDNQRISIIAKQWFGVEG